MFIVHTLRQNENFNFKKIIKLEKRRLPRDSFYGAETKKGKEKGKSRVTLRTHERGKQECSDQSEQAHVS